MSGLEDRREPQVLRLAATVHGRCLLRRPLARGPATAGLLVGFHGYGESAERHLAALAEIPGASGWWLAAVQALHRFYDRKNSEVVGSWMTRQDRELAIADNLAYVATAVAALREAAGDEAPLVYAGFSQGTAMAYRAAAGAGHPAAALLALGGDLPPDVVAATGPLPPVLIGRGETDDWYSEEKLAADLATLAVRGVAVEICRYPGGHAWHPAFHAAAGRFLARVAGG